MRKKLLSLAALAFVFAVYSCKSSSGFESDVRKYAELQCEQQKLMAKDQNDEKVKKELEEVEKDIKEYSDKMQKKYADKKDDKDMDERADKIMDEVMKDCK